MVTGVVGGRSPLIGPREALLDHAIVTSRLPSGHQPVEATAAKPSVILPTEPTVTMPVVHDDLPRHHPASTPAWMLTAREALAGDGPILGFLIALFAGRWMLADWNSYWLDELLSVNVYGLSHPTTMDALRHLAENSIHPPLYQFILYQWMGVFGDSEVATRSLSNLYITLAAFLLYVLVRDIWGRRIGLMSAVAFSVMHTPTYYALETRSYAQTIFLVTLSSALLLRLLRQTPPGMNWRAATIWLPALLVVGANTALLMTHYYNLFWLAAQAAFTVVYLASEWLPRRWPAGLGALAALYGIPAMLFWTTWGGVFGRQLRESSSGFEIEGEGPQRNSVELLLDYVLRQNLSPPAIIGWTLAGVVAGVVAWSVAMVVRRTEPTERRGPWTIMYLACWLVLPMVIVYIGFTVLGVERYSGRYFVFSVVPIAPLLVVAIDRGVVAARRIAGRGPTGMVSTILVLVIIAAWVLPLGHDAATQRKHDWRGIAQQINDMVRANEDSSYILYETAHRAHPMLDYYFDRLPGSFTPHSTLARFEERRGDYRLFSEDQELVAEYDYLVVSFTHSRTAHFPHALELLERRYDPVHRQLNRRGRGFIVYAVPD